MSSNPNSLPEIPGDPREIELIRGLLEKTKQGKIPWSRQGNAITAKIANGLQVNVVMAPYLITDGPSWELATVRDRSGNELIKVVAPSANSGIQALFGKSGLVTAVDDLFRAALGTVGDELDRAINSLKSL